MEKGIKNKTETGNVSDFVIKSLSGAADFLLLISPFIKVEALKEMLNRLTVKPSKLVVIVRWKPEDLLTGVSDVNVYELVKSYGGEMFINSDIHLKLYLSDYKTAIIGSANLTQKGLGLTKNHNIEAMTTVSCDTELLSKIQPILDSSVKLNDELVEQFRVMVDRFSKDFQQPKPAGLREFYKKIQEEMAKVEEGLYVHNFPLSQTPEVFLSNLVANSEASSLTNDKLLFSSKDRPSLKEEFLNSKAYTWQKDTIDGNVRFGKYSELLHNALSDVPATYRKSVKELVDNMFNWTEEFSDEYKIEQYNHTKSMVKI